MPQNPEVEFDITDLSARLLAEQELTPRARILATAAALPGTAVHVYILTGAEGIESWACRATTGDAAEPDSAIPVGAGTLGKLAADPQPVILPAEKLAREDYAHLGIRRSFYSVAYLPLLIGEDLVGAIEIVGLDAPIPRTHLEALRPLCEIGAIALAVAYQFEEERNSSLTSVTRLTQFYDIEKVFNSTLEMDELLPAMGGKMREVIECEAVNIWLLQGDESLLLMHKDGFDPTTREDMTQRPGEGVPGDVSDSGEAVYINDPADERLIRRNEGVEEGTVNSLMAAPLIDHGALVGVIETINKLGDSSFDDDDFFTLQRVCETASNALHNASLLMAERKVEILETLVTVSHEITSTLNLERMLQTIVNAPQAVIPYDRAALALEERGRYRLAAVTGVTQLDPEAPDVAPMSEVLRWAMLSGETLHVRQVGDEVLTEREETKAKFKSYFEATGKRAFYAIPLSDDSGRVGVLGLESTDPDFLSSAHLEILQVLAGQATVALRNAQMYKEVPFISVLQPVLERKRKFMAMEKRRRALILGAAVAVVIFLVGFPLPLRVDGDAVVAPAHSAQLQPEVEGVIASVLVREGDRVHQGQVVARLADWESRGALAGAEAKYQTAVLQMNHALANNDGGEAGVQRVQSDYWKSEVGRAKALLDRTQIRSPMDGVVATPNVENMVGRRLQFGDTFAEVVDTSSAVVDVAIEDDDAGLLAKQAPASIKLNSFPMRTLHGEVAIVSPRSALVGDSRVFYARVSVPNTDGSIRAGMEGRGKIRVGWYPAGYVLFRRPLLWFYSRIWSWFGV